MRITTVIRTYETDLTGRLHVVSLPYYPSISGGLNFTTQKDHDVELASAR